MCASAVPPTPPLPLSSSSSSKHAKEKFALTGVVAVGKAVKDGLGLLQLGLRVLQTCEVHMCLQIGSKQAMAYCEPVARKKRGGGRTMGKERRKHKCLHDCVACTHVVVRV